MKNNLTKDRRLIFKLKDRKAWCAAFNADPANSDWPTQYHHTLKIGRLPGSKELSLLPRAPFGT